MPIDTMQTGFYYLKTRYYNPEWGRFLNADTAVGVNNDMVTYNMYVYCGNNPVIRCDGSGMSWEDIIRGALHLGNMVLLSFGVDTAEKGAAILDMYKDDEGIYHARFDCWQKNFGYNDFYDFAFNVGTNMVREKFPFTYNGTEYIIWAWKGDYINLGAGAEMGIYYGDYLGHWLVDTSLAMKMEMQLSYYGRDIIEYCPSEPQWWITGFNPNYLNVNPKYLMACFRITFNRAGLYCAFYNQWHKKDSRWVFFPYSLTAVFIYI